MPRYESGKPSRNYTSAVLSTFSNKLRKVLLALNSLSFPLRVFSILRLKCPAVKFKKFTDY